jgi:penicillin-binding protein 2
MKGGRRGLALLGATVIASTLLGACGFGQAAQPPGPDAAVARFVAAWNRLDTGGYGAMYDLLDTGSRAKISQADFTARYRGVADRMFLLRVSARVGAVSRPGGGATVSTTIAYRTRYVGDFTKRVTFPLTRVQGAWRVTWDAGLILPELAGDRHLRESHVLSRRASIVTSDGVPLAVTSDEGLQVGVVPGKVKDEPALLASLSKLLGMTSDQVKQAYAGGQPDWFMPVRTLPPGTSLDLHNQLSAIPGVDVRPVTVRYYPKHTAAAQLIGYVGPDGTAQAGLEKSLDAALAGTPGGRLWVVDGNETDVGTVAGRDPVPGRDVVLSLRWPVQRAAETALAVDPKDAVVAEDPRSGEILAIASHPAFDPNDFAFGNAAAVAGYAADAASPLLFRATSGQYPSGSTFKPITAAAALKAGVITPAQKLPCPATWLGLGPPGQVNHESDDLGDIDLATAIARSCNTYFYEVGKRLYGKDPTLLPAMARSFGLGRATGLRFVPQEAGAVPVLHGPGDATNLAIGQGGLLVTPLQMAGCTAALAEGGARVVPRVVVGLRGAGGTDRQGFDRASAGTADVRPGDLPVLLAAMHRVVQDPSGTLYLGFRGVPVSLFGKSGTAETNAGPPDIWFVGGGPSDSPSVVVADVVEEKPGGVHSLDAAAIARQVILAAGP